MLKVSFYICKFTARFNILVCYFDYQTLFKYVTLNAFKYGLRSTQRA